MDIEADIAPFRYVIGVGETEVTHQFRENGNHANGGPVFFAYGYTAIGEPRLEMWRRWYRQGENRGKTEDHFYVDGSPVDDYTAAVGKLKTPPVFTEAEIEALRTVGDDFGRYRNNTNIEAFMYLGKKGAIEWQKGQSRLTDAGRAVLASLPPATDEQAGSGA